MKQVCLSTAYFPSVSYMKEILKADTVLIEQYDHYVRQTYRNRCYIAAANGKMALSIPVERNLTEKNLVKDIRISDHDNWRHQHWQSIVSAYGMSPFFEYYEDDIAPFFTRRWDFLIDFNMEITQKLLDLLEIDKQLKLTDEYCADFQNKVVDLRLKTKAHKEMPLATKPYYQVFDAKYGFLPDLSVLDLIFNMGNESILYLTD